MFAVEGNIGAGKSTLVRHLSNQFPGRRILLAEEPVGAWDEVRNIEGENILTLFYRDQKRYAFSFQILACFTRFRTLMQLREDNPDAIIICERSLLTDYHVFAKMMMDSGNITHEEYIIYRMNYNYFASKLPISGIIYLRTSPEVAYERCQIRNRSGETVSLDYLTTCHQNHDAWILNSSLPTLILDGNKPYTSELEQEWVESILKFIS
jgi:deoxyadenosine/deoxycytidine kinase